MSLFEFAEYTFPDQAFGLVPGIGVYRQNYRSIRHNGPGKEVSYSKTTLHILMARVYNNIRKSLACAAPKRI